jgi:hypothetical protein
MNISIMNISIMTFNIINIYVMNISIMNISIMNISIKNISIINISNRNYPSWTSLPWTSYKTSVMNISITGISIMKIHYNPPGPWWLHSIYFILFVNIQSETSLHLDENLMMDSATWYSSHTSSTLLSRTNAWRPSVHGVILVISQ